MDSHNASAAESLVSSNFSKSEISLWSPSHSFHSLILIMRSGNHTKMVFQVKDVQQ